MSLLLLKPKKVFRPGQIADWRFDKGKNLLTRNQSNCCNATNDTTGFTAYGSGVFVASTEQAYMGTYSLKCSPDGVATRGVAAIRNANAAGVAGQSYAITAALHIPTGKQVIIEPINDVADGGATSEGYWQSANYTGQRYVVVTGNGEWQLISFVFTITVAMSKAGIACIAQASQGAFDFYIGLLQQEKGTGASSFVEGGIDNQLLFDYSQGSNPVNLLLPNQADCCENGNTTGLNKVPASVIISADNTISLHGSYSLRGTKVADSDAKMQLYNVSPRAPVIGGRTYAFSAYAYPTSIADRRVSWLVDWFDAANIYISNYTGITRLPLPAGVWTRGSFSAVAPINAAYASLDVIAYTATEGEYFNIDCMQINEGPDVPWQKPPNIVQLGAAWNSDTSDPAWVTEGLSFGTDDYAIIPEGILTGNSYSVLAVATVPSSTSQKAILSIRSNASTNTPIVALLRLTTADKAHFIVRDNANNALDCTSVESYVGAYHMFTGVRKGNEADLYVDKVIAAPHAVHAGGLGAITTDRSAIGAERLMGSTGNFFIGGTISYLALYNRALTKAEIVAIYAYLRGYLAPRGVLLAA